ncbi:lysophospholipase [Fusarium oxysporum NRRL 32931]|uniref:Lysophospholipase n=1 Tax=Fusarium oxysporum NRRL 32931 TaxID=660029 RepID=W9HF54_FUSOX|nr:lysophospholipase [Fusarium oxysporum NRRL 32931]
MRCLIALTFWAASTAHVVAAPDDAAAATEPYVNSIDIRALPDSPSGNYAPQVIDCPSKRPTIRLSDELSDQENAWVQRRRNNTIDPLKTLLSRAKVSGFDAESYIDRIKSNSSALPNIAIADSSADTHSWPNGTALRATYNRVGSSIGNGTLFPFIPSAETFINERLNQRPTLFGCNADNFTLSKDQSPPPLIFYFPNAPYTTHSNVSTFEMSYSIQQRDDIIENSLNGATQGNSTIDKEWPVCVACAIMSRSWWKANDKVPDACNTCFDRYCWNGKSNDTSVGDYEPNFIIKGSSDQEAEDNAASTRLGPSFYEISALAVAMFSILLW